MYSSYVDEAQDNLLIDALCTILVYLLFSHLMFVSVLRIICGNPEGLFWACDTVEIVAHAPPAMVLFFLFLFLPLTFALVLTAVAVLCKPGCAISAADTSSV